MSRLRESWLNPHKIMAEKENEPTIVIATPKTPDQKGDDIDLSPFFAYLQSPHGHEIASRVLQLVEGVKTMAMDKNIAQAKFNRWMEAGVIIVVIVAVCVLSYVEKLNPTVGVVLGSVVGYFFGKHK